MKSRHASCKACNTIDFKYLSLSASEGNAVANEDQLLSPAVKQIPDSVLPWEIPWSPVRCRCESGAALHRWSGLSRNECRAACGTARPLGYLQSSPLACSPHSSSYKAGEPFKHIRVNRNLNKNRLLQFLLYVLAPSMWYLLDEFGVAGQKFFPVDKDHGHLWIIQPARLRHRLVENLHTDMHAKGDVNKYLLTPRSVSVS